MPNRRIVACLLCLPVLVGLSMGGCDSSDSSSANAGAAGAAAGTGGTGGTDTSTAGSGGVAGQGGGSVGGLGGAAGQAGAGGGVGAGGLGGTGGQAGAGGTAPACGSRPYSPAPLCQQCAEVNCCDALLACDLGTPCGDLFVCLDACPPGDLECQDACVAQANPVAKADAQAMLDCVQSACPLECPAPGTICDTGLVNTGNPECGDCDGQQCCAEFNLCVADPNCMACLTGQGGSNCETDSLLVAIRDCERTHCSNVCPTGICDSGISSGNAACDTCNTAHCCLEWETCAGNPTCAPCASNPGSCLGLPLFTAAWTCVQTECSVECGF